MTALPYNGTSGHSGTDTSQERAERRDSNGSTSRVQSELLALLDAGGSLGYTIKEIREAFPQDHHGTLSGALSNLHAAGKIVMLETKRNKCHVYVGLSNVLGRATRAHGRNKPKTSETSVPTSEIEADTIEALVEMFRKHVNPAAKFSPVNLELALKRLAREVREGNYTYETDGKPKSASAKFRAARGK